MHELADVDNGLQSVHAGVVEFFPEKLCSFFPNAFSCILMHFFACLCIFKHF